MQLIRALEGSLTSGVDWQDALNGLLLAARDPKKGHPRIMAYVLDAVRDSVLCANPCLHADVLIAKCDQSFAAGGSVFGL